MDRAKEAELLKQDLQEAREAEEKTKQKLQDVNHLNPLPVSVLSCRLVVPTAVSRGLGCHLKTTCLEAACHMVLPLHPAACQPLSPPLLLDGRWDQRKSLKLEPDILLSPCVPVSISPFKARKQQGERENQGWMV